MLCDARAAACAAKHRRCVRWRDSGICDASTAGWGDSRRHDGRWGGGTSGFQGSGFRGALLAPGELAAVHEVLRVAGHELGDEHGAARVHARAQELHHVHVAALLQDRDLRAQPTHPGSGEPTGQRGATSVSELPPRWV